MNVLVVAGCCLLENFSANLCHASYINGMLNLGYKVDLLCYSKKDINTDDSLKIPDVDNIFEYYGVSLYEKLANSRKSNQSTEQPSGDMNSEETEGNSQTGIARRAVDGIKKAVRSCYGIYNPSIVWYKRAKKFRSDKKYDFVLSLSYPQVSHLLAAYLIEKRHVVCDRWIQLWEDPWTADLCNMDNKEKCRKAESKLLKRAREIVYVSPLTLKNQMNMFPESKDKMRWLPLPMYYNAEENNHKFQENHYGYFGDYSPNVRNFTPFYNVAVKKSIHLEICGSPYGLLSESNNVRIFPRLSLDELKPHEDNANIAVCLCNIGGGQIPGKIYQYAATDKKVLFILDGTEEEKAIIREYFEKFNRFVFCDNNENSISEAIDRIENNELSEICNEPVTYFYPENIVKELFN